MTLLRRILSERRRQVVPLAVLLAANAVVYAAAVVPLAQRVARSSTREAAVAAVLHSAKARYDAAQATVDGQRNAQEQLVKFYKDVLPTDSASARRVAYTRLEQLARKCNLRPARTGAEPEASRESALSRLLVTMVVAGDYGSIRDFIYELEASPDFVVIENVALSQGEEANAPLVLTIDVSTYYRTKSE